jgi:hypothetical protein
MAKAEEFLGFYQSAHQHLTEVINAIRARHGPADSEQLIRVTTQRARVALHWANDLRDGGGPEERLRAMGMLQESISSLASCQGIARANFSKPIIQPGLVNAAFQYLWLNGETWLVLGEIEQEQQKWASASSAFSEARKAFDDVHKFAVEKAIPLPARFEDLRKRSRAGLRDTIANRDLQH